MGMRFDPASTGQLKRLTLDNPYALRQTADRCFVPNVIGAGTSPYFSGTSVHRVYGSIASLQIEFPNFYGVSNSPSGAPLSIMAGIEYPIGSAKFFPLFFGGARIGVIPSGGRLLSDPVSVVIPAGALFALRKQATCTAGIPQFNIPSVILGETAAISASAYLDNTTSGSSTPGTSAKAYMPTAIVSYSSMPAVYAAGDSRNAGAVEVEDITGSRGEICRSISTYLPHINGGVAGRSAAQLTTSPSNDVGMATYCSHVICEMGVNAFFNEGKTLAVAEADALYLWAFYVGLGKIVYQTTISPSTGGSYGTSEGGETISYPSSLVPFVAWLRDGAPLLNGVPVATGSNTAGTTRAGSPGHPLAGVFDTAAAVESKAFPGAWKTTLGPYTSDGLHCINTGSYAIRDTVGSTGILVPPIKGVIEPYKARVVTTAPTTIAIRFNGPLAPGVVPATSAFAITNTGGADTVTGVSISGNVVTLTKSRATLASDFLTVSYTPPGMNPLQDGAARLATAFSGLVALNFIQPAVVQLVRLTTLATLVEVADPDWGYDYLPIGNGNYVSGFQQGISTVTLPASADGFVEATITDAVANGAAFGFKTASTNGAYTTITAGIIANGSISPNYRVLVAGAITTPTGTLAIAAGDIMRVQRTGTTITMLVSKDNRNTWTVLQTLTGQSTAALYVGAQVPVGQIKSLAGSTNLA